MIAGPAPNSRRLNVIGGLGSDFIAARIERVGPTRSRAPPSVVNPNSGEPEGAWQQPRIARNRVRQADVSNSRVTEKSIVQLPKSAVWVRAIVSFPDALPSAAHSSSDFQLLRTFLDTRQAVAPETGV
jgi:hypothetical protein